MKVLTNSFRGGKLIIRMFLQWFFGVKKERRTRSQNVDLVTQQVQTLLKKSDQKLILQVRG